MKLWGDNNKDFYSGEGSHRPEIIEPYITVLKTFLTSFKSPLSVCDLGCGDFNVGIALVKFAKKYVAVDIVENLIVYNKENFVEDNLEFFCIDIAVDNLPEGDCAIVRQVLQHLSNSEVEAVVSKLSNFKYVIITEHVPAGDFIPNKDIISGQGTRLKKQSGIDLLAPPFNFMVKKERQLLSISLSEDDGVILTTLYYTEAYK